MPLGLYNIWLPEASTSSAEDDIQADIQQAGLLGQGSIATEKIAADTIDFTVTGHLPLGDRFARKHATELESLAASGYEAVPLFDQDADVSDPKRAYYEVQAVDVSPAHPTTQAAYEYTVALSEKGTHSSHWRGVRTTVETVSTGLATGGNGLIGVDGGSVKAKWIDAAQGRSVATVDSTVSSEFGAVDRYAPSAPSFDDPTLLYEADFDAEYQTDVVVYDDRGESDRAWSFSDGQTTASATQWVHIYHGAHEFEGRPVVDNGLLRLRFDESNGNVDAWQYNAGADSWGSVSTSGSFDLVDADLDRIGPADVRLFCEFEDTNAGSLHTATISVQRGLDEMVLRIPDNESSIPSGLESQLSGVASDQSTDAKPRQTVVRRSEAR